MVITLQRVAPGGELEHGVFTQLIAVVGILITASHLNDSLNQKVLQRMIYIGLMDACRE